MTPAKKQFILAIRRLLLGFAEALKVYAEAESTPPPRT
jgi:hypothetical protein